MTLEADILVDLVELYAEHGRLVYYAAKGEESLADVAEEDLGDVALEVLAIVKKGNSDRPTSYRGADGLGNEAVLRIRWADIPDLAVNDQFRVGASLYRVQSAELQSLGVEWRCELGKVY